MADGAPKPLKFLVWTMGLVLVGGFLFLVGTLATKTGDAARKDSAVCAPTKLPFMDTQILYAPNYANGVWAVAIREGEGVSLLTLDACSGKLLTRIDSRIAK